MAFQIQVGFRAVFMAAAGVRALEHRGVGGAGVKPDLQNVAALGVAGCVGSTAHARQDFFGAGLAPGFDAALLDHVGGQVQNVHGARVQLARILVQEKRQRHAPAALA
ncbi:MAG: hypothetical protein ACD_23C00100G0001 [uncultured bacterium]|nr:MAG: hypothetical protein ACD_23C00100G0001 [uncultured bacterium]